MKITIDPITRIEGHAKITIILGKDNEVQDAKFHVTQYRGFEKLCQGRPFFEMPRLMARTCGICPVSHLIASSKACDQIMAVKVPQAGVNIRKIINYAQILQSHALSFFYLSSPDFIFGFDADPSVRNILKVAEKDKSFIQYGIELRKFGQQIIEMLGEKRVHPNFIVPGGVEKPITKEDGDKILDNLDSQLHKIIYGLDFFKNVISEFKDEIKNMSNFDTFHLAIGDGELLEHYDGDIHVIDSKGGTVFKNIPKEQYKEVIGEKVEEFSYLKSPYLKAFGYPEGIYRVGPMSRLNIAKRCGTDVADRELSDYRKIDGVISNASFMNHYARLIEMIFSIEKIGELLQEEVTYDDHIKASAAVNASEGVGISEAPRGTLIHHYRVDKNGLVESANLIIATGHNNLAMNKGILQAAKRYIKGENVREGFLNRIEGVIRCYDPCLSCSTHALGKMPFKIEIYSNEGVKIREIIR